MTKPTIIIISKGKKGDEEWSSRKDMSILNYYYSIPPRSRIHSSPCLSMAFSNPVTIFLIFGNWMKLERSSETPVKSAGDEMKCGDQQLCVNCRWIHFVGGRKCNLMVSANIVLLITIIHKFPLDSFARTTPASTTDAQLSVPIKLAPCNYLVRLWHPQYRHQTIENLDIGLALYPFQLWLFQRRRPEE